MFSNGNSLLDSLSWFVNAKVIMPHLDYRKRCSFNEDDFLHSRSEK